MSLKSCPCGKKVGPNTRSCPSCGHDFIRQVVGFVLEEDYEENGGVISPCKCGDMQNCIYCNEEYEINNYYKCGNNFYYYNATGRFCKLNCLLKSDLDKTKIILYLLNKLTNQVEDKNIIVEELKKEFSSSIIDSLFKDQKEQYKEISYRNKIPDFDSREDRQLRMFAFKKKNNLELTEEEIEKYEQQNNVDNLNESIEIEQKIQKENETPKPFSFLDYVESDKK